jgi:adenylate kinase family enzyme
MPDCIKNGWVMDGLPATKKQAELFNRQGIIPTAVFSLQLSEIDSLKRTINFKNTDNYEWDLEVVH